MEQKHKTEATPFWRALTVLRSPDLGFLGMSGPEGLRDPCSFLDWGLQALKTVRPAPHTPLPEADLGFGEENSTSQEKPNVRKLSDRNSSAGNGCANLCSNFMRAWHLLLVSAEKPPCP